MTSGNIRRKLYVFTLDSVDDVTNISFELLLVEQFNLKRHNNALLLVANNSYYANDVIFFSIFSKMSCIIN
jgi:hypothetical protein